MMGDREPVDFTMQPPTFSAENPNELVGMAYGLGGPLWVKVTVDGKKIAGIEVLWNLETPGVGTKAVAQLPAQMVDAQSIEVDDFTGATSTSHALKEAVADALKQGGLL